MANNPYNNKVELADGTVLMDLTSDTVTPQTLIAPATAHSASGEQITGVVNLANAGNATPMADSGDGAAGIATAYSREDHVHPISGQLKYGICTTAGSVSTKEVTINGITELLTGMVIYVKFRYGNTVDAPTLNVNNLGNVAMVEASNYPFETHVNSIRWYDYNIKCLIYDGSRWISAFMPQRIYYYTIGNTNFLDWVLSNFTVDGQYFVGFASTDYTGWPCSTVGTAEISVRNNRIIINAKILDGRMYHNVYNGNRWIGWCDDGALYPYTYTGNDFLTWVRNTFIYNGVYFVEYMTNDYTGWPGNQLGYAIVTNRNGAYFIDAQLLDGSKYYNVYNTSWLGWKKYATNDQITSLQDDISQINDSIDQINSYSAPKSVAITSADPKISSIDAWRTGDVIQLNCTIAAQSLSAGWNAIAISGLSNLTQVSHRISGSISLGGSADATKVFHVRLESSSAIQIYASAQNAAQIFITINIIAHS